MDSINRNSLVTTVGRFKTIRFEKLDAETPTPSGNPIFLHAMDEHSMVFGDIRVVRTGIRLYTGDSFRLVESTMPGLVVLGVGQDDYDEMKVTVLCCAMEARLSRMQRFASMKLYESNLLSIRFAEFSNAGTRLVAGDSRDIGHG